MNKHMFDRKKDNKIHKLTDVIKFSFSSIISFLIDYSLFTLFSIKINNISLCNILARIISSSVNYTLNRKMVFKSKKSLYKSIISYFLLAFCILCLNTMLLNMFVYYFSINKFIAKLITEILLFIISFIVQKQFVFREKVKR